jgi:UDP-N-acetylmuramoyl-tripeptide--D-alanyl-D-alanine ligase
MDNLYSIFLKSDGVTTDTRSISPGTIFFALKGENFNGNEFAQSAIEKGAAFAVVDEEKYANNPKCILVEDTLKSLTQIAQTHRENLKCPVFAITGSNGKTTTKELVVAVLQSSFNVSFTKGNLNNHIGVPLTILSATNETEILVVEMGANHQGEIDYLCNIAQPHYGLITNVGKAHLEGFGSPEIVFQTKTELFRYIFKNGKGIIVNADDETLADAAKKHILLSYGLNNGHVRGQIIDNLPLLNAQWAVNNSVCNQKTKLFGSYNIYNVLAAVCAGKLFHVENEKIVKAIESYTPANNRSQFVETQNKNRIILDAYNANPSSMNAALDEFIVVDESNKIAVLGSMLELGKYSHDEHLIVLQKLSNAKLNKVMLVGEEFYNMRNQFPQFEFFQQSKHLSDFLEENPIENAYIIIKGSRRNALEQIVKQL